MKSETEGDEPHVLDGVVDGLKDVLPIQVQTWLQPALKALVDAGNAKAALELLASNNPLVDDDVLTEAIARAMFVVELVGADTAQLELNDGNR